MDMGLKPFSGLSLGYYDVGHVLEGLGGVAQFIAVS